MKIAYLQYQFERQFSRKEPVAHEIGAKQMKIKGAVSAIVIAMGISMSNPTEASVIYTYTGNPYTTIINNDPPSGTFTTSMRVSGWFEVAAPFGPSMAFSNVDGSVLDFAFNDGRTTLSMSTPGVVFNFSLSTDALGNFAAWDLATFTQFPPFPPAPSLGDQLFLIRTQTNFPSRDTGQILECVVVGTLACDTLESDIGRVSVATDAWIVSTTTVPEPATLALMGLGLAGLGFTRRKAR